MSEPEPSCVDRLVASIESVIRGKRRVVENVVVALLARGHVLLEDVPGLHPLAVLLSERPRASAPAAEGDTPAG